MNPDVKSKWIAALTSGEFQQGRTVLRSTKNEYCCLGVLCELHRRDTDGIAWTPETTNYKYHGCKGIPPDSVFDWAGLTTGSGNTFIRKNDVDNATFAEIAEYIGSLA